MQICIHWHIHRCLASHVTKNCLSFCPCPILSISIFALFPFLSIPKFVHILVHPLVFRIAILSIAFFILCLFDPLHLCLVKLSCMVKYYWIIFTFILNFKMFWHLDSFLGMFINSCEAICFPLGPNFVAKIFSMAVGCCRAFNHGQIVEKYPKKLTMFHIHL